jgi:hypothetical protein
VLRPSTAKTIGRPTISTATDAAIRKALKKGDVGIPQDRHDARRRNRHGAADQGGYGDRGIGLAGGRGARACAKQVRKRLT